jgi:hypothetical protein
MLPQAGRLSEHFVADITLIRLLLRVYAAMVTLVGSLSESDVAMYVHSVLVAMIVKRCASYMSLIPFCVYAGMLSQDFSPVCMQLWYLSWVA